MAWRSTNGEPGRHLLPAGLPHPEGHVIGVIQAQRIMRAATSAVQQSSSTDRVQQAGVAENRHGKGQPKVTVAMHEKCQPATCLGQHAGAAVFKSDSGWTEIADGIVADRLRTGRQYEHRIGWRVPK
jgi:hypothetical protein